MTSFNNFNTGYGTATCGSVQPWYSFTGGAGTAATLTATYIPNVGTYIPTNTGVSYTLAPYVNPLPDKLEAEAREIELPDGAKLIIDDSGNYRIEDKDAKVTYKANRVREFSPHLNASDMLAQFVEYVQKLGIKQREVLGLPLETFINWLIIEAAERDNDQVPDDVVAVKDHQAISNTLRPKCLSCGRFIPREHRQQRFDFCSMEHGLAYAKQRIPAIADKAPEQRILSLGNTNMETVC